MNELLNKKKDSIKHWRSMISSLYQTYSKIYNQPCQWNYYYPHQACNNANLDKILSNESDAQQWLMNYFKNGSKHPLAQEIEQITQSLSNNGAEAHPLPHVISTYLLGIHLKNWFNIEKRYGNKWMYYWYLTCLFHDVGYKIEQDTQKYPICDSFDTICEKLKICSQHKADLQQSFDALQDERFTWSTILRYFDYCRTQLGEHNFINHGIIGGILFYDRMIKWLDNKLNGEKQVVEEHILWSNKQKTHFQQIAQSIILHNIWLATDEDTKDQYGRYNLSSLCCNSDEQRMWFDNPITNLLIFCDSIEPIKQQAFSGIENLNILKGLHVYKYNKSIHISRVGETIPIKFYNKYVDTISHITDWFKVDNLQETELSFHFQSK